MWRPGNKTRIALALCAFSSALFLPWWTPLIFMLALAFFWRAWEVMLLGLMMDLLWSPLYAFPLCTLVAVVVVWLFEPIRSEFITR